MNKSYDMVLLRPPLYLFFPSPVDLDEFIVNLSTVNIKTIYLFITFKTFFKALLIPTKYGPEYYPMLLGSVTVLLALISSFCPFLSFK